jgi:DNA-binding transcriptional LysR family regulator
VLDAACAAAGFAPRAAVRTEQAPSALNLARAGLGVTLLPGNVVPSAFDGVLRRPEPPVRRMLSAYTRVRPDPITAAFVQAICHHTMATPAHILSRLEPSQDG